MELTTEDIIIIDEGTSEPILDTECGCLLGYLPAGIGPACCLPMLTVDGSL